MYSRDPNTIHLTPERGFADPDETAVRRGCAAPTDSHHAMELRHHRGHDRATVQGIEVKNPRTRARGTGGRVQGDYQKARPGRSRS